MIAEGLTPERWRQIEAILDELLDAPASRRETILRRACGEDAALRGEVERLLDACLGEDDIASEPAAALLAPLLADPESDDRDSPPGLGAGARVGRFEVLRALGGGGMGVVYLARDPVLDRPVALKLLPPHLTPGPEARRRLLDEARAAAALDHPRIETIYEVGTTSDGRLFIAMACYEGETLAERLERGPLAIAEAVEVAAQVADGLAAAHAGGIVHRDIKPGNLILLPDGSVKIVDFGIARFRGREGTLGGATPGTVAYMSPEQTRSEEVDGRSDLWSLGVVLYEMLTGVRPFRADSEEALVCAIRQDPPPPLRERRPEVPETLARLVERCLRVSPGERPAGAVELREELHTTLSGAPGASRRRAVNRARVRVAAACALLAAAILSGLFLARRSREGDARPVAEPPAAAAAGGATLAVLPFQVKGLDGDLWREGMADLLAANLDGVAGIRTADPHAVIARWRSEVGEDVETPRLEARLEVARRLRATHVLEGSLAGSGGTLLLTARIYDAGTGRLAGHARAEGPADSLLALVDRLSVEVVRAGLAVDPGGISAFDLSRLTTSSLPALEAYLEGEREYRRSPSAEALPYFQRAVEADSTFALALYRLSQTYGFVPGSRLVRHEYAERAARLAGRLPERERLMFEGHRLMLDGWPDGARRLEEFVTRYPDDVEGWFTLGEMYFHAPELARPGQFRTAFQRSLDLDPGYGPAYTHLIDDAFARQDSAGAADLIARHGRLAPATVDGLGARLAHALAWGDGATRAAARRSLDTLAPDAVFRAQFAHSSSSDLWEPFRAISDAMRSERIPSGIRRNATWMLARAEYGRGQVRSARERLGELDPLTAARHLAVWYLSGHGDSTSALAAAPILKVAPTAPYWFLRGAVAARLGNRSGAERETERLLAHPPPSGDLVDTLLHAEARALGVALRAYVDLARGRGPISTDRLENALTHIRANGPSEQIRDLLRYEFGRARLERDDLEEARALLEPLATAGYPNIPTADLWLGRTYERLGERGKAREQYARFVERLRDCDPELRPLVEEARGGLARLEVGTAGS